MNSFVHVDFQNQGRPSDTDPVALQRGTITTRTTRAFSGNCCLIGFHVFVLVVLTDVLIISRQPKNTHKEIWLTGIILPSICEVATLSGKTWFDADSTAGDSNCYHGAAASCEPGSPSGSSMIAPCSGNVSLTFVQIENINQRWCSATQTILQATLSTAQMLTVAVVTRSRVAGGRTETNGDRSPTCLSAACPRLPARRSCETLDLK